MEEYSYNMQYSNAQFIAELAPTIYKIMITIPKLYLIALLLSITLVNAFRFTLNSKTPELTMLFNVTAGKHTLSVVSSGQQNHDVMLTIDYFNQRVTGSQPIFNKSTNDVDFTHNYPYDGRINVTIVAASAGDRNVSFDFYSEDDPLVKMIDKKDLKVVEGVLSHVHQSLSTISRNQQFHIQRDQSHKATLQESESSIKWTGIVKIVFLLSSALIQLWIMKGFFKGNSSHPYEPVETG